MCGRGGENSSERQGQWRNREVEKWRKTKKQRNKEAMNQGIKEAYVRLINIQHIYVKGRREHRGYWDT